MLNITDVPGKNKAIFLNKFYVGWFDKMVVILLDKLIKTIY